MKTALLAVIFAALAAAPAGARETFFPDLTSGRYEVGLDGMLCHTCAKVILEEVSAIKEVQKVSVDFDHDLLQITVRTGQTVRLARLRKALKKAAKRVDLGTQYVVRSVLYKV